MVVEAEKTTRFSAAIMIFQDSCIYATEIEPQQPQMSKLYFVFVFEGTQLCLGAAKLVLRSLYIIYEGITN